MNEEETELFPEDEDADLAPPPGATEHDELGCALALALWQAAQWVYFRPLCCEHGGHTKAVM